MKSSSLIDTTIDMALQPIPKWPKEDKSKEIEPFNPVFMYVFTDIMGVNKEVLYTKVLMQKPSWLQICDEVHGGRAR